MSHFFADDAAQEEDAALLDQAVRRPMGDGRIWLTSAWQIFRPRMGTWMLMSFLVMLLLLAVLYLSGLLLPAEGLVSSLLLTLIFHIIIVPLCGGMILACDAWQEGGDLRTAYLFAGWQYKAVPLLQCALFFGLLSFATEILIQTLIPVDPTLSLMQAQNAVKRQQLWFGLLSAPQTLMMWHSIAFICLYDLNIGKAVKNSLTGTLKNLLPLLLHILLWMLFAGGLAGSIGLFAGILAGINGASLVSLSPATWLMLIPVICMVLMVIALAALCGYTSFRNIWTDRPLPE